MDFLGRVREWCRRGLENSVTEEFILANEMMRLAFDEKGIQRNPFRSMIGRGLLMGPLNRKFVETFNSHQRVLARLTNDEDVDGTDFSNLMMQLAAALREFGSVLDQENEIVLGIFLCRYAVFRYERGVPVAPIVIVFVVSGMAYAANRGLLHLN